MKVKGLDGRSYKLQFHNRILGEYDRKRSQFHLKAKELLSEIYPLDLIFEEVYLPGCPTKLYVDFYLPLRKLAIEVQGSQHSKFNQHFHSNISGYLKSKQRDNAKKRFCEINDITLIELLESEIDKWKLKLIQ